MEKINNRRSQESGDRSQELGVAEKQVQALLLLRTDFGYYVMP